MIEIKCPACGKAGSMMLAQDRYQGPYRCWKCRELFTLDMDNSGVKSCEPLSQEEFEKQQEIEAMKKNLNR
ncbi:hypothetical protein ACFLV2_01940 [Chloroflexota bacterium]